MHTAVGNLACYYPESDLIFIACMQNKNISWEIYSWEIVY